eukprot:snap_masked-scaffold_3-processed-gene-11.14-mRNA-1 protein AED:1.00 eAED:1.00 QI:0/0/0/0/1/1/2/0/68
MEWNEKSLSSDDRSNQNDIQLFGAGYNNVLTEGGQVPTLMEIYFIAVYFFYCNQKSVFAVKSKDGREI